MNEERIVMVGEVEMRLDGDCTTVIIPGTNEPIFTNFNIGEALVHLPNWVLQMLPQQEAERVLRTTHTWVREFFPFLKFEPKDSKVLGEMMSDLFLEDELARMA